MEYCIVSDNSGHKYVIPHEKRRDWSEWCSIDEDDERSWKAPEYADIIGGGVSLVLFKEYRID